MTHSWISFIISGAANYLTSVAPLVINEDGVVGLANNLDIPQQDI